MGRRMLRVELGDFRVATRGIAPVLLLKAEMAQTRVDFQRVLSTLSGAFQFLHGIAQAAAGCELDGVCQCVRRGGAFFLAGVDRVAAHQFLNQFVVDKKDVLIVVFRHLYLLSTSGTTLKPPFRVELSPRPPLRPTPPPLSPSLLHPPPLL